jgi:hypothetical protein
MRARGLAARREAPPTGIADRTSAAGLAFLRGRDADVRLRRLAALRTASRPLLGALAGAFTARRAHHALGYRSLGDYGRERLGVGARTLREWARVWRALEALPLLRQALLTGQLSWSAARRVVAHVRPETQAACLECVRGRTLRAVAAIVRAFREAQQQEDTEEVGDPVEADERIPVRIPCTGREAGLWQVALELARRVAGEALPVWECAERIAAEAAGALGRAPDLGPAGSRAGVGRGGARTNGEEHGLRPLAFPAVDWAPLAASLPEPVAALARGLSDCSPRELDRRLRAAIAFLQGVDLETGRILRQMTDRGLFEELGFSGLSRYAEERLDVSPRTARRWVALARSQHRAPALAHAFRRGRIHALQARVLARVANLESAREWVERARQVTLRRLEEDVAQDAEARPGAAIAFRAPPDVAALFGEMIARAGSLERLLAHAVAAWVEEGARFRDYADFERDGYRCTVPGCTARRNLQSHHVRFRSAGGPDEPWNRTTLCAHHHLRGVHGGTLRIRGRAPEGLVFELGSHPPERFRSYDLRHA